MIKILLRQEYTEYWFPFCVCVSLWGAQSGCQKKVLKFFGYESPRFEMANFKNKHPCWGSIEMD